MCKFKSHVTRNDVIKYVITKNSGKQWETRDLCETKQNIYRWKGFDKSYSKM